VPHQQSDHETAANAPHVELLTPWADAGLRIRSLALAHYAHALVTTIGEFFVEHPPHQGMDLCLGMAMLPNGKCIARAELRPNRLNASAFKEFLAQVKSLPRPPVHGGPVAFVVRLLIAGGRPDREPDARNDPPTGFVWAVKKAEAECAPMPSQPGPWARWMTACRQAFSRLRNVFLSRPPAKPALPVLPSSPPVFQLRAEDRTIERLTEMMEKLPELAHLHLWRGQLYQQRQEYEAAIADYSAYLSRQPADAQGYFERGVCQHLAGSREKALADYNEALVHNPRAAAALIWRARLYMELAAVDRALQDVAAAQEIDPWEPEWLLVRAKMLATQGRFDEAEADLDRALQLDPHHAELHFIRAMVYRDRPRPADRVVADCELAIAGFSAALRLNRDHVAAYAHRAGMRQQIGDLEGAMADCDEALRRDANHGFAHALRGHIHLRHGDHRKAIADCEEALRLGTDGWLVQLTLADAHLGENELEEAMTACEAALKLSPQHAGVLVLRAKVQMQMGLLEAALDDASAAIGLAPAWNAPRALRGNLHGLRGEPAKALADLNEALRLEPADAAARYNRGVASFQQKEYADSLEDFNEAERLGFREAMLYFMRATVHLQQIEPERARGDLDEALRVDPECAPALNMRANLLLHQGQHDAAMRDYDELIRLCPNVAAAYGNRAGAWIQLGQPEKAEQDFREAVQLDPGRAEAYALQSLLTEAAFHHGREDFPQAIARASEALRSDPECGPAYALRAAAYWYMEQHVEAVEDYNKLLEMEEWPSFSTLSSRGQVSAEMGEFQNALEDLNRAIDVESKGVPPRTLAYAHSGRALARAGLGRFEEAARDFEASIRNCPANAWVHYNYGLMYHQLGKPEAAAVCFQLALDLREPPLTPRKRERARGYVRRFQQTVEKQEISGQAQPPKRPEAESHLLELLKLAPDDLAIRRFITIWALENGKQAFAREQAEAALSIEAADAVKYDGNPLGRMLRGLVGLWEKDWAGAEGDFRAIIAKAPKDFAARNNIALALVEQDDPEKQRQALEYAVANLGDHPKNADALSTLGWVHFRRGEFDQAESTLDQAAQAAGSKLDSDTATYLAHIRHHRKRDWEAKGILENVLTKGRTFSMRPEALLLYAEVKDAAKPPCLPNSDPLG
jgi:tetratricopeptide (TPR) repeat protein